MNQSPKTPGKSNGKTHEVNLPARKEEPIPVRGMIPSVDSFSLADLPIAPLNKQTNHLANDSYRCEWFQVVDGKERKFYVEVEYGNVAPSADTETFLQTLIHLAHEAKTWTKIPLSSYKINKTKGTKVKGGDTAKRIARHIHALYGMNIKTNFVYDRNKKKYTACECRILSGFTYESDELGAKKTVTRELEDGTIKTYETDKLESVSFSSDFVENFLDDLIPFDLDTYYKIKNPTPRKLYKITNKFISTIRQDFRLDMYHFCATRLGMRSEYLEDYGKSSRVASKLRPDAKRANEFFPEDYDPMYIAKDKRQPSGYAVGFKPQNEEKQPQYQNSMTKGEKKVYQSLKEEKVWHNVAYKTVMDFSKNLGTEGLEYLMYTIRKFKEFEQSKTLKVPPNGRPAVLVKAIKENWWFSEFKEKDSARRKRKEREQEREEEKRYGKTLNIFDPKPQTQALPQFLSSNKRFNLKTFKEEYPEVYKHIYDTVYISYKRMTVELKMTGDFWKCSGGSIEMICKKCWIEYEKGNKNYQPDLSAYTKPVNNGV